MAKDKKPLQDYQAKRNFQATNEPAGAPAGTSPDQAPLFVIQRHEARSTHFDLRLEVDGVLASWAVPKGPSLDPREKRFATQTEDHPLEYAGFEGTIPKGNYGAGTVIVWDIGRYQNLTEYKGQSVAVSDAITNGHLKFWLQGQKLTGAFALTRTKLRDGEGWLLVKVDDEGADRRRDPASTQPTSALSGRTNAQLEE